ncbi:MAG: hypothetical protein Q4B82_09350 [Alysiella sp.]|uniref:hypothetical protein n=1 Tax=Alysiella sp. TaxID=1872483 RepID=UPI0026DBCE9B|nr:hypothetical protein [Alysiella sp.]MDO4434765.1 hypothetical protein [Alysiella sp.]
MIFRIKFDEIFKNTLLVGLTVVSLIACSAVKEKWERMSVVNISCTQEIQGLMPIEAKYT